MTRPQDPVPLPWYVVLEETVTLLQQRRWMITQVTPCESREQALQTAQGWAHNYKPNHPTVEHGRMVFRTGDDVWTTWLEGASSRWHFRVSVTQREA